MNSSTGSSQSEIFQKYFNQLFLDKEKQQTVTGPYISISREFGCMANPIAQQLAEELNKRCGSCKKPGSWKWLNKEILEESSKALGLSTSKIEYVFKSKQLSTMDEIVKAMATRYYKSDKKIRNTIIEVIRTLCRNGNVIIVGRGAVAFTKDNNRSLHIKLQAPLEWRVDRIAKNYDKSRSEALKYILEIDKERKFLIDSFVGYETDNSIFDLVLNRKTMSTGEIVSTILGLAESRGFC